MALRGGLAGLLIALVWIGAAEAHEKRTVAEKYRFTVGFLEEPAFSGQMNGVDLKVASAAGDKPVQGLEETLRVIVRYGDAKETLELRLRPRYKQPGAYGGYFLPARPGQYSFRIAGTVEEIPVDELFVSGPGRFSDVEDSEILRFP